MRRRYFFSYLVMSFVLFFHMDTQSGYALERENTYGFLAGMSSFNQNLTDGSGASIDLDPANAQGAYAGVFGERYLGNAITLNPGVYFSQKGVKLNIGGSSATSKADYLELSANLRWYFVDDLGTRAYLGAGLGFGILMGGETISSLGAVTNSTNQLAKNELSFQGGAGVEFELNADSGLLFGLTYCRGLSNHLNVSTTQGRNGLWNGFYGFAGIRFKNQREANTPLERAREYLRTKNGFSEPNTVSEDAQSAPVENWEESRTEDVAPREPQVRLDTQPDEDGWGDEAPAEAPLKREPTEVPVDDEEGEW
ncbi:PorT family protein [bacterium]|nr:PorT family protein [bacterium]NBX81650.1 PorT family protein [bacterium]